MFLLLFRFHHARNVVHVVVDEFRHEIIGNRLMQMVLVTWIIVLGIGVIPRVGWWLWSGCHDHWLIVNFFVIRRFVFGFFRQIATKFLRQVINVDLFVLKSFFLVMMMFVVIKVPVQVNHMPRFIVRIQVATKFTRRVKASTGLGGFRNVLAGPFGNVGILP